MQISIELWVTADKMIMIKSGEHELTSECTQEIKQATKDLQIDAAAENVLWIFGAE